MSTQTMDFAELHREILGTRLAIDQRLREALHVSLPRPTVRERASVYGQPDRATPPPVPNANTRAWDIFNDD